MRILLFSKYGSLGASSRLRSYQYIPYLEGEGHLIDVSPFLGNRYLEDFFAGRKKSPIDIFQAYLKRVQCFANLSSYDLVWVEYELLPWLPGFLEQLFNLKSIPYIVDYDDAIFHRYDKSPNRLIRKVLGKKIDQVMKMARFVIVGNQYIAERAESAGVSRIAVIPTAVDLSKYQFNPLKDNSLIKIGWIGTPHTAPYLKQIEPALRRAADKFRILFVGVGTGDLKLNGIPSKYLPWTESTEAKIISNFNVGIMPLRDAPFERGKCGYKLIQYMACGVPVIASPVGANKDIVEHGRNGFLSTTNNDWFKAIEFLVRNPEKAIDMGFEGRHKVEREYCTQVVAPKLADIIRSVV